MAAVERAKTRLFRTLSLHHKASGYRMTFPLMHRDMHESGAMEMNGRTRVILAIRLPCRWLSSARPWSRVWTLRR